MGLLLINLQHNTINNSSTSEHKKSNHEDNQKRNAGAINTVIVYSS